MIRLERSTIQVEVGTDAQSQGVGETVGPSRLAKRPQSRDRPKSRSRRDRPQSSRRDRGRNHRSQSPAGGAGHTNGNPWENSQTSLEGGNWEAVEVAEAKTVQLGDEREQLLVKLRLIEEAKGLLEDGASEKAM